MAVALKSGEENDIIVPGTLPTDNVGVDVFGSFVSQETSLTKTFQIQTLDLGKWLALALSPSDLPNDDGTYDLSIFSSVEGSATWADIVTQWSASPAGWDEASGVIQDQLISRTRAVVEGAQDFTTPDYIAADDGFSAREYTSDEEDFSSREYNSEREDLRSQIPR